MSQSHAHAFLDEIEMHIVSIYFVHSQHFIILKKVPSCLINIKLNDGVMQSINPSSLIVIFDYMFKVHLYH